jgi:Icc-related predicted phosphoesterase
VRLVIISDTHEQEWRLHTDLIPNGDLLICAGDFSWFGEEIFVRRFDEWLASLAPRFPKGIICIAGNHELTFDPDHPKYVASHRSWLRTPIYLNEDGITIDNLKIWGSPYSLIYGYWAFMCGPEGIKEHWDKIPTDTDILITHGPPFGIMDSIRLFDVNTHMPFQQSVGCRYLRDTVLDRVNPKVHIFGHIHGPRGIETQQGTIFVNAAALTSANVWDNSYAPYVVEI